MDESEDLIQESKAIDKEQERLKKKRKHLENEMELLKNAEKKLKKRTKELDDKRNKREEWETEIKLNKVQKQFAEWCENICKYFGKDWKIVFKEIQNFNILHHDYGYAWILDKLLGDICKMSSDLTNIIAQYAKEENPILTLCASKYENGFHGVDTWLEAKQAMHWLWWPPFQPSTVIELETEFVEISSGMGYNQHIVSYNVDPNDCEGCEVCDEGAVHTVSFTWDEDEGYQSDGTFKDEILHKILNSIDRNYWVTCVNEENSELIPAVFFAYFADQINWK